MPLCTYHTFTFTHRTAQHTNTVTVHRIKGFRLHYGVDSFPDPDEEQRVDLPRVHVVTTPRHAHFSAGRWGGQKPSPSFTIGRSNLAFHQLGHDPSCRKC